LNYWRGFVQHFLAVADLKEAETAKQLLQKELMRKAEAVMERGQFLQMPVKCSGQVWQLRQCRLCAGVVLITRWKQDYFAHDFLSDVIPLRCV
jgi:hypothetical protein